MSATKPKSGLDEQLQSVFQKSPDPVLTAVEVAEVLGISQQAAHAKLSQAHEDGLIERKKTGARSVVWWLSD